mmetsp:Transcript_13501/g.19315  ORF Transcript_13501/g.19315 Transcript_13501/m.19315 type:complete len:373 (+) Transcript_13501:80-1198(+)
MSGTNSAFSIKKETGNKVQSSSFSSNNSTRSTSALHILLSPDGYYTYFKIEKPRSKLVSHSIKAERNEAQSADESEVDYERVKKTYRRLSLIHHPDRPNGDAATFRVLNRAKRVLTDVKLRKQYDLIGLDLEEDEDENAENMNEGTDKNNDSDLDNGEGGKSTSSSDSVMGQLASATLAGIFQILMRTLMMAVASTLVCRYKLLLIPVGSFLLYIAFQIHSTPGTGKLDVISPLLITVGLILMHYGRGYGPPEDSSLSYSWSRLFWFGEALVMAIFMKNSLPEKYQNMPLTFIGVGFISFILTLILRGKIWRYLIILALGVALAIISVLAFPIMEMIMEEIMNEKLRKIGEKVREHATRMEKSMSNSVVEEK